jgi:hypothetical protein
MKIPAYIDIPEAHQRGTSSQAELVSTWFFEGGSARDLKERPGVDRRAVLNGLREILGSYELPHEHKIAAAAWLVERSFELPQGGRG